MASQQRSAAADYAKRRWKEVTSRPYNTMNLDGVVIQVDPRPHTAVAETCLQQTKRAELLANIEANKQEALRLPHVQQLPATSALKIIEDRIISSGVNYSSLPQMGNAEEFFKRYSIDGLATGRRLSDNKKVKIKKIKKSEVAYWGHVNGHFYPLEYCNLRLLSGCSGIANLLDAFVVDQEFILVLETTEVCSSLEELFPLWCSVDPIPEPLCKLIFSQLVEAVQQCHNSGVFHRDIKLANILLDGNSNKVKLTNFDISALARYSPFEDNPGTKGYMSPEMYNRSVKYEGSSAAVYSMGVVLHGIVFRANGWKPINDGIGMPDVSSDCLDLICKMTATRPEDRLPFDKILDHPWIQSAAIEGQQSIPSNISCIGHKGSSIDDTRAKPSHMPAAKSSPGKYAKLLANIEANKQEALGLVHVHHLSAASALKLIEDRIISSGVNYSSLPQMGNAEEFFKRYSIDGLATGRRLSDNKKVRVKKIKKSEVAYWGHVNGHFYPLEYCNLRLLSGCSGIANLLDAFVVDQEFILVLETMEVCSSLEELFPLWCSVDPIPETRCKIIFSQLVEAVEQCHNSGVFHRDIKLANILLDGNSNKVKLTNFDISALARYSPFEDNPGTKGYMSPEMYDKSVKYEGSSAAVYSMGVVLHGIVFRANGWKPINDGIRMPDVSSDCLDLICKMTAARPEDRLPFDKILDHPWIQSAAIEGQRSFPSHISSVGYKGSSIDDARAKPSPMMPATKSSAGSTITHIIKEEKDHQKINASPKLENPAGSIKPMPLINTSLQHKNAELLAKINTNKQKALGLVHENRLSPVDFKKLVDKRFALSRDVYRSIPLMGNEDEYVKKYIIDQDELIGKGGSGSVFRGRRLSDNKKVAIKKIKRCDVIHWCNVIGRIYPLEYCNLRLLNGCSGIANLLDAFDVGGQEYILVLETMDVCSSIADLLHPSNPDRAPIPETRCKTIFRQLVKAVDQCLKAGIIHRDIKPGNILLETNTNEVKLIDFDLSALARYSPFEDNLGTEGYKSPEMYSSVKYEGLPADVYSMGVVLHNMIFACSWKIIDSRLPMPSVSTECLDLICQMTAARPEDRLAFDKILDHPWMHSAAIEGQQSIPSNINCIGHKGSSIDDTRAKPSPMMPATKPSAEKHAELLANIEANKQEALGLVHVHHLSAASALKLIEDRIISSGVNYSSLPLMGNEEQYIKKYSIDEDEWIGKGGSGSVFRGRRLSDNKKVAIKKVKKWDVAYWSHVNGHFYPTEYCNLRLLSGCNRIANLLDAFVVGQDFILVLETMDVCSSIDDLFHPRRPERGPIPETRSKIIFRQLVKAVDECHKAGIFHRDIKLANILLEENTNEVKLIDFDFSALARYSPFVDNPGTRGYMSPEMYDSSAKYEGSPAAVYSMGVVLHDMIFYAHSWRLIDSRLPIPNVSTECLDLICQMTATRPEDRLPFDKIIDHPWMQS